MGIYWWPVVSLTTNAEIVSMSWRHDVYLWQEKLKKANQTKVEGIIEEILLDVAVAADQLESELSEHVFDKAVNKMDNNEAVRAPPGLTTKL